MLEKASVMHEASDFHMTEFTVSAGNGLMEIRMRGVLRSGTL